jgi:hypothetical protein
MPRIKNRKIQNMYGIAVGNAEARENTKTTQPERKINLMAKNIALFLL